MSITEIIRLLGGPTVIAGHIEAASGVRFSARSIQWWKYRQSIPKDHWLHLESLAASQGVADRVTMQTIARACAPRQPRPARPRQDDAPTAADAA